MFIQHVKHYHQWLCTAIPIKTSDLINLIRFPLIQSEYKARQKDQALATCIQSLLSKNAIERVENVKSLRFYSRLFLVTKPHQRWRLVIHLSRLNTFLHIEKFKMETTESIRTSLIPGEWVSSIDRSAPQVFTMIVKEVKLMALSRGLTQSLGWIINQEKSELKPTPVFSFVGYEYHLDSALVKPTPERWLKLQDLILRLKKVKTCFDCKMFDVANWVACLNGENGS